MKNKLIWFIVVILLLVGGTFLYKANSNNTNTILNTNIDNTSSQVSSSESTSNTDLDTNNTNTSSNTSSSATNNNIASKYTTSSVASHSSASSCWSIISSKVYDLTSYINQHPGGSEQILAICGKDGTSLFDSQHMGNAKVANMLANFYLGDLSN